MTEKTGGPAFPGLHPSEDCRFNDPGMTLRDYFAAKAMAVCPLHQIESKADWAYRMADAMLKAREQ